MSPPRPLASLPQLATRTCVAGLAGLALAACRAPAVPRVPLETACLPARIDAARSLTPPSTPCPSTPSTRPATPASSLRFSTAVGRLRDHNPRVVEARADARPAQARGSTATPLPNPEIALGPVMLSGLDGVRSVAWGLEGALGWKVLLGGKRQMMNGLNAQNARAANVRAVATEREEYLGLRRSWIQAALGAYEEAVRAKLLATTREARDGVEDLVRVRSSTAVDLVLLDLDTRRLDADQVDAVAQTIAARAALAQRIGARTDDVDAPPMASLPTLPSDVPSIARLRAVALAGHPALDRIRAEYAVAEQRLRLEAANAIPDLDIAGTYEREDAAYGLNRLGLPLGIELPIFDRNQPAIAEATARRDALRERFEAAYTRILGELEAAHALLLRRRERARRFDEDVEPAAVAALSTGRQALLAGETDALRFIDLLRSTREVEREKVQATRELYLAWAELERAIGAPLLRFPDEPTPAPTARAEEDV